MATDASIPTVVVVDDSSTIRATVKVHLKRFEGRINLEFASDGFEALALIAKVNPALVLADVLMPRLSGFQLCAMVKQNPATQKTKLFLLTSKDGEVDKATGKNCGADGYIIKPFTKDALQQAVLRGLPDLEAEVA